LKIGANFSDGANRRFLLCAVGRLGLFARPGRLLPGAAVAVGLLDFCGGDSPRIYSTKKAKKLANIAF